MGARNLLFFCCCYLWPFQVDKNLLFKIEKGLTFDHKFKLNNFN